MLRTGLRAAAILVGTYVGLWAMLWLVQATHGLSDQDPSFLLVLLVYALAWPSAQLLRLLGVGDNELLVFLIGCIQWLVVAFVLAGIYQHRPAGGKAASPPSGKT